MKCEKNSVTMENRVTIDTSVPFRSVKEAVVLFGEKIIASQAIASQLSKKHKAIGQDHYIRQYEHDTKMQVARESKRYHSPWLDPIATRLEETKRGIKTEREKGLKMANYILALEEELKNTKRELKKLKDRLHAQVNPAILEAKRQNFNDRKNRHVTFTDPLFAEILNIYMGQDASKIKIGKFAR